MAHKILWNPKKFVDERSKKDFPYDGYWFSMWSSILMALTVELFYHVLSLKNPQLYPVKWTKFITIFLVAFSLNFIFIILCSFITRELVGMFKKDISFAKALACNAYSFFLFATGIALSSVFAIFPGVNVISPIILMIFFARGMGIFVRFLHEYASLSNIEGFVLGIIVAVSILFGYAVGSSFIGLFSYTPLFYID